MTQGHASPGLEGLQVCSGPEWSASQHGRASGWQKLHAAEGQGAGGPGGGGGPLTSGCLRRMCLLMEARVDTLVPHSWQLWASTLSWVSCTCFCSMYSVTYFLSHTEHVHCLPTAHTCVCRDTCTHTHTHKDKKRSTGHERGRPTVHRTGGEAASPFAQTAGFVRQVGAWDQAARLGRVWGAPSLAERGATSPLWYREVRDWVSEVEVGSFLGAQGPPLRRVAPDILKRSPPRPRAARAPGAPLRAAPRSPVWMSLWVSIVFLSLNVFPHSSHMKSLIPAGDTRVSQSLNAHGASCP